MTQYTRKVKKVPARSQVRHRKGVAQGVGRETNAGDSQLLPECVEIPFKVPNGEFRVVFCAKKKPIVIRYRVDVDLVDVAPDLFPKLYAEGYKTVFVSLAQDFQNQVFKVYVFFRQSQHLTRSK